MEDLLVKSKFFGTEDIKNPSLDRLSCSELKILLERQHKLLSNSTIVSNLPDGGDKIRLYISRLEEAIQVRGTYEDAVQALSELKIEERSPLHCPPTTPNTSARRSVSDSIDSEKLDKVRDKLASRPVPRSTQLLSGSDLQELVERDREREESLRKAEPKLRDFLGMFKVGNVKLASDTGDTNDIFVRDSTLREDTRAELDPDTDSEMSDQTDTSSTGIGDIGEGLGLLEEWNTSS